MLDASELKGTESSDEMSFFIAAAYDYLDIAIWLSEKGVDVNVKDSEGRTAVHVAAEAGRMEFVKWLVEQKKLEIDGKAQDGKTAVHYAAESGHLELVI